MREYGVLLLSCVDLNWLRHRLLGRLELKGLPLTLATTGDLQGWAEPAMLILAIATVRKFYQNSLSLSYCAILCSTTKMRGDMVQC